MGANRLTAAEPGQGSSSEPLVSIVIPSYNHAPFIEKAIRSVLDQTYPNIELVVIDDGSTDGSWPIIEALQRTSERPFQALTKPNEGLARTLNRGISQTRGELIALLASDDEFLPDKIERQVDLFRRSPPNVVLVHSGAYDSSNGTLVPSHGSYKPAEGACFEALISCEVGALASSMMFMRKAFEEVGGFDPTLVGEDKGFWVALAAAGYEFAYDPTPLVIKRAHGGNLSRQARRLHSDAIKILMRHKSRFAPEEVQRLKSEYRRGTAKLAAAYGQMDFAWSILRRMAAQSRSPEPIFYFLRKAGRYYALRLLPGPARRTLLRLRALRAMASRRSDQPRSQHP